MFSEKKPDGIAPLAEFLLTVDLSYIILYEVIYVFWEKARWHRTISNACHEFLLTVDLSYVILIKVIYVFWEKARWHSTISNACHEFLLTVDLSYVILIETTNVFWEKNNYKVRLHNIIFMPALCLILFAHYIIYVNKVWEYALYRRCFLCYS